MLCQRVLEPDCRENYGSYESDDRMTMHIAATVGQKDVRWLEVRAAIVGVVVRLDE